MQPLYIMLYGDLESGTGHSLKEVNACLTWHRVHTGCSMVTVTVYLCYL